MIILENRLNGVLILETRRFEDERGWFAETFSQREWDALIGHSAVPFVQDNEVWSRHGVIRGLHFQHGEHAQAKLVRAVRGRILDVAVDLRADSPTFGQWTGVEISDENRRFVFVPRGFAHGYSVLSDEALVDYKCDNFYEPSAEGGVRFDDPKLSIDWGLKEWIVSERDMEWPLL